jgi:hypothetical protein
LRFVRARSLSIFGEAFRKCAATEVALDVSNARIDSFDLREPLPQSADLQNCDATHWEVTGDHEHAGTTQTPFDRSTSYRRLLDSSWPFAQDVYARLERDYRDLGEQRIADDFLKRMGWRLWRWSYLREATLSGAWLVGAAMAIGLVAVIAVTLLSGEMHAVLGVMGLVVASSVFITLTVADGSVVKTWRRGWRFFLGSLLGLLHVFYGFGVRWWLLLLVSVVLLAFVTFPMLRDCRNLAAPADAAVFDGPRPSDRVDYANERIWSAGWGGTCPIPGSERDGKPMRWTAWQAFALAVQYHVPIIPGDGFYRGEIEERVRPLIGPDPYLWGNERKWFRLSPESYTRIVYLASWLVLPFSLVFFAGRMQRKYRLQQG